MAWTAPKTWTTGEVVTAASMNEQIRDNELALQPLGWTVIFDGGGSTITTDTYADVFVPKKCDITSVAAFGDDTDGTLTVDVWKITSSDFSTAPPDSDNNITGASDKIIFDTDSSAYYYDNTLSGWTTALAEAALLRYYVEACANITFVSVVTNADVS